MGPFWFFWVVVCLLVLVGSGRDVKKSEAEKTAEYQERLRMEHAEDLALTKISLEEMRKVKNNKGDCLVERFQKNPR